ncbi:hypothetical protein A1O7_08244 [Cladophialophora yegresii CBS 114405]|uniref:FAD-binding domain-containing protein n=1 Tax=Cladophialophora yegresii CBS 114405 TaxID=1182544 RepID=W9VI38_9EURO|nr:uncharacterized protein A1O7_08244 [Cladophialophora yegresii CBS 114405]EXJ55317.1 hypothetical protein A1O7_08244 [Cladophialophora yegresii CBS 114405]
MSTFQSSPMSTTTPPIVIIGGGLAGLTLSIGLAHNNIPHQISELAPAFAEIGSGIALGPNSVRALEQIDPRINDGFQRCVTYNEGVETDEYNNGTGPVSTEFHDLIKTVTHSSSEKPGRACFHRAKFLDELIKLIPPSIVHFGKTLQSIEPTNDQNLVLHFADGTTVTTAAVIACDGIKSVVRRSYILADTPNARTTRPQSTFEYAYRGMYTKQEFQSITKGQISPNKGTIFCGTDAYIVMYPVEKGQFINMVAVKRMPDAHELRELAASETSGTLDVKHDDVPWIQAVDKNTMMADFAGWGEPIQALISHIKHPERWSLFDHLPAPTYVKGKVAILGDAAHASTPHQGQGAGMAFEDSLVMSGVLGEVLETKRGIPSDSVQGLDAKIEAAFKAYDQVRCPRTQAICRTSREMGDMLSYVLPGVGSDLAKIETNLAQRMNLIGYVDLQGGVQTPADIARKLLA